MNPVSTSRVTDPERVAGGTATCRVVTVLGLLASFAAVEHGVGEALQGLGAPASVVIQSWPDSAAFSPLNGEPALTVLPDLVLSGVVTIAVAVVVAWYVLGFARRRHGSLGLLGLAALLLLVGGGFGPPLLLVILAVGSVPLGHGRRAPGALGRRLAHRWRPLLALTVAAYLGLFPGTVLLYSLAGIESAGLVMVLTLTAFVGLVLTLLAARASDRRMAAEHISGVR